MRYTRVSFDGSGKEFAEKLEELKAHGKIPNWVECVAVSPKSVLVVHEKNPDDTYAVVKGEDTIVGVTELEGQEYFVGTFQFLDEQVLTISKASTGADVPKRKWDKVKRLASQQIVAQFSEYRLGIDGTGVYDDEK